MWKFLMFNKSVEEKYVTAGRFFGFCVSYIYMGEPIGFKKFLAEWEKWEAEYARRGYRTISLDQFIELGGYGEPLKGLGQKREKGEKPIFHSKIYRYRYLGRIKPIINATLGKVQVAEYVLPTTED